MINKSNFGIIVGSRGLFNSQLANLKVSVMVHASDDDTANLDMDHRRDAFCGKLSVCNNIFQRLFLRLKIGRLITK